MKTIVLYSSVHGRTRKVVQEVVRRLPSVPDVCDVKDGPGAASLDDYQLFMFFCPTYGDEELPSEMERFLRAFSLDLTGRHFVICELGNYGGYDDASFGALHILRRRLEELRGRELCEALSLDALPRLNQGQLLRWIEHVNRSLVNHAGH